MADDRIVAVGSLTRRDLEVLGRGFSRHFPIDHDGAFDDLLAKPHRVRAAPGGKRVRVATDE